MPSISHRKLHYWGAIASVIPVLVIVVTGVLLLLKKQLDWVQPSTVQVEQIVAPQLSFENILSQLQAEPKAGIRSWADVRKVDVRPNKGIIKVLSKDYWEVQLEPVTGQVLKVAYRRSNIIEAIHDGSFFHQHAKLWLFLPASVILFLLSITGLYLFVQPFFARKRKRKRLKQKALNTRYLDNL